MHNLKVIICLILCFYFTLCPPSPSELLVATPLLFNFSLNFTINPRYKDRFFDEDLKVRHSSLAPFYPSPSLPPSLSLFLLPPPLSLGKW